MGQTECPEREAAGGISASTCHRRAWLCRLVGACSSSRRTNFPAKPVKLVAREGVDSRAQALAASGLRQQQQIVWRGGTPLIPLALACSGTSPGHRGEKGKAVGTFTSGLSLSLSLSLSVCVPSCLLSSSAKLRASPQTPRSP